MFQDNQIKYSFFQLTCFTLLWPWVMSNSLEEVWRGKPSWASCATFFVCSLLAKKAFTQQNARCIVLSNKIKNKKGGGGGWRGFFLNVFSALMKLKLKPICAGWSMHAELILVTNLIWSYDIVPLIVCLRIACITIKLLCTNVFLYVYICYSYLSA